MTGEILLEAEGLQRAFGERRALRNLSLTLRRGEVVGLLGPNGAGKSTTLRILGGVLPPNAGTVRIGGVDLLDGPRRVKRALGYLPELPPLYPEMRVRAYLEYCARLRAVPRTKVAEAVDKVMGKCGLADVGERLLGRLSKGYQQRVGIAQAIVHNPSVVILDEPTVGLDPLQIRAIRQLIGSLREQHGVIVSSHILPEIQSLCDRVIILYQGSAVYQGALSELASVTQRHEYLMGLDDLPEPEALRQLPGVEEVEVVGDNRVRLRLSNREATDRLLRHVLDAGWGLREWSPVRDSLEQLFVSLTHGEAA